MASKKYYPHKSYGVTKFTEYDASKCVIESNYSRNLKCKNCKENDNHRR